MKMKSDLFTTDLQLSEKFSIEQVKEMLGEIVKSCHKRAEDQKVAEGHIKLDRGFATIPLPGIDVPFHSRYLWAGVMPFRACELFFLSLLCIHEYTKHFIFKTYRRRSMLRRSTPTC